jgi:site-specific DNA-methyltransferase (adenine-specific)
MENIFLNEDMFSVMPRIADKSVHLIFADLPYNQTACAFDKDIIDLEKLWLQFKRILKPNGQILFTTTTKFGNKLINSNPKWFRSDLVWKKGETGIGFLSSKKAVLRNHEMIYLFHAPTKAKDLKWTYNPQMVAGEPYTLTRTGKCAVYHKILSPYNTTISNGDRFPKSVINIKNGERGSIHPTQKPVELLEWLIKTYSNEDDFVLDPCAGSGSTLLACRNTGRKYIGIEMNKEYFDKAVNRMNE